MPIFEIQGGALVALRQIRGGAELYEREIEALVWSDLEAMTGEALFPVARQPTIPGGGRPDVVALDKSGRVVVIEIKRDVDRAQLAQTLEYAGWARTASLDELAGLYHRDSRAFFSDWQEFTGSVTPVLVTRSPRLILIARDFQSRTQGALDFLQENGLPVTVIPVAIYEHADGRRFVDVESDYEPPFAGAGDSTAAEAIERAQHLYRGRRVQIADLLDTGLLIAGEALEMLLPRRGELFHATVLDDGSIKTESGDIFTNPSRAASGAAGGGSFDGWTYWRVPRLEGCFLADLRQQLLAAEDA